MKKGHIEGRKYIIATEKGTYMAEKKKVTFDPTGLPGQKAGVSVDPPRPPTPQVIMDVRM